MGLDAIKLRRYVSKVRKIDRLLSAVKFKISETLLYFRFGIMPLKFFFMAGSVNEKTKTIKACTLTRTYL
jgi:hypothetical protein